MHIRSRQILADSVQDSLADVMHHHALTPQAVLDRPNMSTVDKRDWCIARAESARRRYAQGQTETIHDVLSSRSDQFAHLNGPERIKVAKMRWSSTIVAKQLVAEDQMYTTWAGLYT